VITPLFGGGVTPGEADPITVVRATEVRGHLRFWWRATNAWRFKTVAELKLKEGRLWGNTETPSQIIINIPTKDINPGRAEIAFRVARESGKAKTIPSPNIAPYAAFPFLPDKTELKRIGWESEAVLINVAFTLDLQYPQNIQTDVESALWAWETFGGIGARTRRGFGALQWLDQPHPMPVQTNRLESYLRDKLGKMTTRENKIQDIPSVGQQMRFRVTQPFDNPIEAWKHIINELYKFRQARYDKKFGLSKWPEANEIRRLFGINAKLPEGETSVRLVQKFPRAVFGLPINFHMPHDSVISEDLTLEGVPNDKLDRKYDRLASPLILRPLACAGGKYVGLAVILNAPTVPPCGLRLKGAQGNPQVTERLTLSEARQIEPLGDTTDVLQKFLNSL